MSSLDEILAYFSDDPLRVLYILGGAGGAWFWLEKWFDRIRLRVRLLKHSADALQDNRARVNLEFEVVNIGKGATSLEPFVYCVGYDDRLRAVGRLDIIGQDRILPPHSTRYFSASGEVSATYPFWLFKAFHFVPTRGRRRTVRSRSSEVQLTGQLRYNVELFLYLWAGLRPDRRSATR